MNRIQTINQLIKDVNAENYLQIGLGDESLFNAIKAKNKFGIGQSTKREDIKANDFFKSNKTKFNFILIDNVHVSVHTEREVVLAYNRLPENGILLIHDVIPPSEESTIVPRISDKFCGEVYKVVCGLINSYALQYKYIDDPVGFLMITKKGKTRLKKGFTLQDLSFDEFEKEWKEKIMNL